MISTMVLSKSSLSLFSSLSAYSLKTFPTIAFIAVAVFKANAIITVLTAGAIGVIYSLLVEKKIISKFGDKSLELPQGRKKSKGKTHCNSDVKAKGDDSDDE